MKRLLLLLLIVLFGSLLYAAEPDSVFVNSTTPIDKETCTCKGKRLCGKVKIVTDIADFDIQMVDAFSDFDVKVVPCAMNCGEWQFVDSAPDFTVRFVDAFPDFTIRFVEAFPGVK